MTHTDYDTPIMTTFDITMTTRLCKGHEIYINHLLNHTYLLLYIIGLGYFELFLGLILLYLYSQN